MSDEEIAGVAAREIAMKIPQSFGFRWQEFVPAILAAIKKAKFELVQADSAAIGFQK